MSAGTPGPWLVDPDGWDDEGLCIYGGGVHGSAPEHGVAFVVNYGQGVECCEADAELIAAAPALRAALHRIWHLDPYGDWPDGDATITAQSIASDALDQIGEKHS